MFSFQDRSKLIHLMNTYSFDVLVIGGGITGAGIALDAASRGLSVALVDMQDFAAGTSSRSTKLIHGGLRYLKQLEFRLVAEVGREREIVYENSIHVTTPEKMLLPIYKNGSLGRFSASIGLKLYDSLAKVRKSERRKMLSKKETLKLAPFLREEGLLGAGFYVEYKTDDARLTLEVIKKAVEYKALCLNYAKVTGFVYDRNRIVAAKVRDEITGETITIHATQIVNAAGPWVDVILEKDNRNGRSRKSLKLTKGIHIVFDKSVLPLEQAIYFDTDDGRMVFAIPRGNKVYVGTTDTFYEEDPVHPVAKSEEVAYLLNALHSIFPSLSLKEEDVESTWAGIRPLIFEEGKNPSEISRKDEIWTSKSGLMTIAGGKLTGYRIMAERIVDLIVKKHRFRHAKKCMTKQLALSGAEGLRSSNFEYFVNKKAMEGAKFGLNFGEAKGLAQMYGTNIDRVFDLLDKEEPVDKLPKALFAQLLYSIYDEMAYTPADFFIRRTGLMYFDIAMVEKTKDAVIDIMSDRIGYSEREKTFYTMQLNQMIREAKGDCGERDTLDTNE
ncbi:MAG: glycerol-3-phosphate dehydrogenase/oxidase [Bacilli bacterium]|uniref:Glycerol-3-phosphate dehydrogenase n=1 Tax=Ureibacillus suwonensis TaxID=313007 RepID=A0ABW0RCJ7_9BACL|nr:glycerol-3-phosphate dehydrogenase [Bacilli bacterium]